MKLQQSDEMKTGKHHRLPKPDLPASGAVDASLPVGGVLIEETETNFEQAPIIFLSLVIGLGVLLLIFYITIIWLARRSTGKWPTEGEIKWQRRIEAIREMQFE